MQSLKSYITEARATNPNNFVIMRGGQVYSDQDWPRLEQWCKDNCARLGKLNDKLDGKEASKCAIDLYMVLQERARKNAPIVTVGKLNNAIDVAGSWSLGKWPKSGDIISMEKVK